MIQHPRSSSQVLRVLRSAKELVESGPSQPEQASSALVFFEIFSPDQATPSSDFVSKNVADPRLGREVYLMNFALGILGRHWLVRTQGMSTQGVLSPVPNPVLIPLTDSVQMTAVHLWKRMQVRILVVTLTSRLEVQVINARS